MFVGAMLPVVFLLAYFGITAVIFPILLVTFIAIVLIVGMEGGGGGWWRKRRDPGPRPNGPEPLPDKWDPPDSVPDWVSEEVKPVSPVRTARSDG